MFKAPNTSRLKVKSRASIVSLHSKETSENRTCYHVAIRCAMIALGRNISMPFYLSPSAEYSTVGRQSGWAHLRRTNKSKIYYKKGMPITNYFRSKSTYSINLNLNLNHHLSKMEETSSLKQKKISQIQIG